MELKIGMRLVKCTEPDGICKARDIRKGDVFTIIEVRDRGWGRLPAVRVIQDRTGKSRIMYTSNHFTRDDGTYSIYNSCIWEVQ